MIDPRGPRFGAAVTTVVLAIVLLTGSAWLLAFQAVVFAIGAWHITKQPYGVLYRKLIRPRLEAPRELEAAAPPRFAQGVGFGFAAIGVAGFASGLPALGFIATGFALAAAFLNAVFGYCLGCEVYLLIKRITTTSDAAIATTASKGVPA